MSWALRVRPLIELEALAMDNSRANSSYSSFVIHVFWNVECEARIEPPTQTEYFRSGGAMTLIFIVGCAS